MTAFLLFINPCTAQNVSTAKVDVHANGGWVNTNVYLTQGDQLVIKSQGAWSNSSGGKLTGPDGWGPYDGTEVKGANIAALVGQIGAWKFPVGTAHEIQKIPVSGWLQLAMNDIPNSSSDNKGSVIAVIRYTRRWVVVPAVVNLDPDAAVQTLLKSGLLDSNKGSEPGFRPKGRVTRAYPMEGTNVQTGSTVSIWTALGANRVPQITGRTPGDAQKILIGAGFRIGSHESRADNANVGLIIEQDPDSGSLQPVGSQIHVVIAVAQQNVQVPPVVGMQAGDAEKSISDRGLRPQLRAEEMSPHRRGTVIRVVPKAGTMVDPGSTVVYWIASGNNVVPSLQSKSPDEAIRMLKESGFRLGTRTSRAERTNNGRVVAQTPEGGSVRPIGAAVDVVVGTAVDAVAGGASPDYTWVYYAVPAVLLVGGLSLLRWRSRARVVRTDRMVKIRPSIDFGSATPRLDRLPIAQPAVHVRASVEIGEVQFDQPLPVVKVEIRHE